MDPFDPAHNGNPVNIIPFKYKLFGFKIL
jgi:hypothetical protein